MVRIRSIVAALAVGAVAAASVPAVAQAADPPVVNWAQSDYDNDYGTLLVSATAADGVTALKAHILTYDTRQEVATTEAFTLRSGTATDGVWASAPLLLDNLGNYQVDVEVTDAGGQHVRQDGIGSLFYAEVTFFENVSLNRTKTTYDKRTVTLRGTLKGRRPGSGVVTPIGGASVTVEGSRDFADATTKADGTFAGTIDILNAVEDVWAGYGQTLPFYTSSVSEQLRVTVQPRPVRVTAALDKTKLDRGDSVTFTGQVSWKVDGTYVPRPGVDAFISACSTDEQSSCTFIEAVTTDADGRFSYTYTPYGTGYLGVTYLQRTAGGSVDPYVGTDFRESRKFVVRQPSAFTSFYGGRYDQGLIGVYGSFEFTGGWSPLHYTVKLQYSASGVDGWRTYTTFTDQQPFEVTGVNMPGTVYWRATYAGDTEFQPATSEVIVIPAL